MRHVALLCLGILGSTAPALAQAPTHASFVIPDVSADQSHHYTNLDVRREGATWVMSGCRSELEGGCDRTFHRPLSAEEGRTYEAHWREMGAMGGCRFPALGRMEQLLTVAHGSEHIGRPLPTDATRRAALAARIGGLGHGGDCDSVVASRSTS